MLCLEITETLMLIQGSIRACTGNKAIEYTLVAILFHILLTIITASIGATKPKIVPSSTESQQLFTLLKE